MLFFCFIKDSSNSNDLNTTIILGSLQNLSQPNLQQLLSIVKSSLDFNSCLVNCSNQGQCKLNQQTQKYLCECNKYFMGSSCQTDTRPCLNNKCLNDATCVESSLNMTSTSSSYTCQCPSNGLFYGEFCENRINVCENTTCSLHGYCIILNQQNSTLFQCKCFNGYSGDKCEIESTLKKVVTYVQWTTTIICIICFIIFWTIVIGNDLLSYFKIGHKRIDINKWRREKIHGNEKPSKRRGKQITLKKNIHVTKS